MTGITCTSGLPRAVLVFPGSGRVLTIEYGVDTSVTAPLRRPSDHSRPDSRADLRLTSLIAGLLLAVSLTACSGADAIGFGAPAPLKLDR